MGKKYVVAAVGRREELTIEGEGEKTDRSAKRNLQAFV